MQTCINRNPDTLLNEHEVSDILGMALATIRAWRTVRGGGPSFIKLGRAVRYDPKAVREFMEKGTVIR